VNGRQRLTRATRLSPTWLTAIFGFGTLAPLLLLTYFSITRSSDAVEREATARVESTAEVSASFVRAELDGLAALVDAYAKRPALIDAFGNGDPASADIERIAFHLSSLRAARPGISVTFASDAAGILIDVVPATPSIVGEDFSFRDWYQGVTLTRRPYVSEAYVTAATGNDRVVAASALVVGGTPRRLLGVLVAGYSLGFIQGFAEKLSRNQGVRLTITDQAGVIVASPTDPPSKLVSIAGDARVRAALHGETGSLRHAGANGESVAAYTPVEKHGWTVHASVPRAEAFASVRDLRRAVLSIATLLGLVLVGSIGFVGLTLRRRTHLQARDRSSRAAIESVRDELNDQELRAKELAIHAQVLAESQALLTAASDELATQHSELELAHGFSERLAQETDVAALATCILQHAGEVVAADIGMLHAVDSSGALALVARRFEIANDSTLPMIEDSEVVRALAQEKTIVALLDTGCVLYVPLVHAGRPLGVLTIGRRAGGDFSVNEREAVDHVVDQAVTALAHACVLRDVNRLAALNRAVLDATTDAIRMVDLEGRTVLTNTAMQQIGLNISEDASIWASNAKLAARTTDPDGFSVAFEALSADPELEASDVYRVTETGAWIQRYSGPVRDTSNHLVGRIFVLRDISGERNAQQLKSDLVATVSHELRTPLTGILGFAELLAMDDLDEESRRSYIKTIRRESIRLRDLINDFLDLQRIEAGSFQLQLERVALAELLREQASLFGRQSGAHTFELELEGEVDVVGESDRIAQVIANLFSNAIKYSPEGGVVNVRARGIGASVRVEVTDSGVGIPLDQQRRIFEKFFRVDSTSTRRIGGTGLGLALSRDIIEAHAGTIGFSSVDGQGTTFWFELSSVEGSEIEAPQDVTPPGLALDTEPAGPRVPVASMAVSGQPRRP